MKFKEIIFFVFLCLALTISPAKSKETKIDEIDVYGYLRNVKCAEYNHVDYRYKQKCVKYILFLQGPNPNSNINVYEYTPDESKRTD